MSPLFVFKKPRQGRTFIFSPTRERAMWYCRRTGTRPHARDVYLFSGAGDAASYRGFRFEPEDKAIVLEDFWGSRNSYEIALTLRPSGLDLHSIPVTYSRHVS